MTSSSELYYSIFFGTDEDVKFCIKKNPDCVQQQCPNSGKLLHHHLVSIVEHRNVHDLQLSPNHVIVNQKEKLGLLIQTYPEGLTIKDREGAIPLHAAAASTFQQGVDTNESMKLLALALHAFPAGSQIRDSNGCLPLEIAIIAENFKHAQYLLDNHWGEIPTIWQSPNKPIFHRALETKKAPIRFLHAMMSKVDGCAQVMDSAGRLPLHICAHNSLSFAKVKLVLDAYPNALKVNDEDNQLPLTVELMKTTRLDVVSLFIEKCPKAVFVADKNGLLPIHHAVANNNITHEVLQLLKNRNPSALRSVLLNGDTLLHHALKNSSKAGPIVWLVKNCPISIRAVNNNLEYPVHCAARSRLTRMGYGPQCIRLLVAMFPLATQQPDLYGNLPLHHALVGHAPQQIIGFILEAFMEAIYHANKEGDFPLHLDCARSCSSETLQFLINHHPSALKEYNKAGHLPFHQACLQLRCKPQDVANIDLLVQKLGLPTLPLTSFGAHPLFLACQFNISLSVIWKLVQQSPELFQSKNSSNMSPEPPLKKQRISTCPLRSV